MICCFGFISSFTATSVCLNIAQSSNKRKIYFKVTKCTEKLTESRTICQNKIFEIALLFDY